jgi:hypothetical protein
MILVSFSGRKDSEDEPQKFSRNKGYRSWWEMIERGEGRDEEKCHKKSTQSYRKTTFELLLETTNNKNFSWQKVIFCLMRNINVNRVNWSDFLKEEICLEGSTPSLVVKYV